MQADAVKTADSKAGCLPVRLHAIWHHCVPGAYAGFLFQCYSRAYILIIRSANCFLRKRRSVFTFAAFIPPPSALRPHLLICKFRTWNAIASWTCWSQ